MFLIKYGEVNFINGEAVVAVFCGRHGLMFSTVCGNEFIVQKGFEGGFLNSLDGFNKSTIFAYCDLMKSADENR